MQAFVADWIHSFDEAVGVLKFIANDCTCGKGIDDRRSDCGNASLNWLRVCKGSQNQRRADAMRTLNACDFQRRAMAREESVGGSRQSSRVFSAHQAVNSALLPLNE
jgi:hypothetical protein